MLYNLIWIIQSGTMIMLYNLLLPRLNTQIKILQCLSRLYTLINIEPEIVMVRFANEN